MFQTYDEVFTISEVSEILKLSPQTIRRLIRNKEIVYFKVGKSYRITKEAICEYINRRQV